MTDLRKAAEMALDFCEDIGNLGGPYPYVNETAIVSDSRKVLQALRQALAQPDEVLAEREACAKLCEDICLKYSKADDYAERVASQWCAEAIRARSEKRPVKSYCGGKPNYCTPEQGNSSPNYPISESSTPFVDTVNTSQARVEYDRQGNIARLFGPIEPDGTLLYTAPPKRECVDAVNISQERVDETVKREHEPYGYLWFTHQMERRFTHYRPKEEQRIGEVTPIYTAPPKREWVGLTHEERDEIDQICRSQMEALFVVEAKLKEKNT